MLLFLAAQVSSGDLAMARYALAGTAVAALASIVVAWIGHRKINDAIGTPNGKGNVVQMSERQIAQNEKILSAIGDLNTRLTVSEEKIEFYGSLFLGHVGTPNAHGGYERDSTHPAARY